MRTVSALFFFMLIMCGARSQNDTLSVQPDTLDWEGEAYIPDTLLEVHNGLKYDPLQVLRGEISVFYERRISNRVSIELGVGVTRRNWTDSWFNNTDADDLRRNITVYTGPAFRLGVRYYLMDSPELNGVYIMPQLAYRIYEKSFAEIDSTGNLNGQTHLDRREIGEFNITFGYQHLSYNSNFFYDIYFGIGHALYRGARVKRQNVPIETLYYTEPRNSNSWLPVIGLKLGLGF